MADALPQFACTVCGREYKSRSGLLRHEKKKHFPPEAMPEPPQPPVVMDPRAELAELIGDVVLPGAINDRILSLAERRKNGETLKRSEIHELETFYRQVQNERHEEPGDSVTVKTQKDAAKFFNVTLRQFQNWCADGCPGQPGCYSLNDIRDWRDARGDRRSSDRSKELQEYDREKAEWSAKIQKMKFEQMAGLLVSREEVEKDNLEKIQVLRASMLQIPTLADALHGKTRDTIRRVLYEEVRGIINVFAGESQASAQDRDADDGKGVVA